MRRKSRDEQAVRRTCRSRAEFEKAGRTEDVPVSSHPEIEEEIEAMEGGLDELQLRSVEPGRPPAKPIVSVDGRDIEADHLRANPSRDDHKAA